MTSGGDSFKCLPRRFGGNSRFAECVSSRPARNFVIGNIAKKLSSGVCVALNYVHIVDVNGFRGTFFDGDQLAPDCWDMASQSRVFLNAPVCKLITVLSSRFLVRMRRPIWESLVNARAECSIRFEGPETNFADPHCGRGRAQHQIRIQHVDQVVVHRVLFPGVSLSRYGNSAPIRHFV